MIHPALCSIFPSLRFGEMEWAALVFDCNCPLCCAYRLAHPVLTAAVRTHRQAIAECYREGCSQIDRLIIRADIRRMYPKLVARIEAAGRKITE